MKKEILVITFILLLMPIASAAITQINIHTLPRHEVFVYILDSGEKYSSLQSFPSRITGFDGVASFNSTVDEAEFGVSVIIKKDGVNVFSERLDNQARSASLDFYLLVNESDELILPPTEEIADTTNTTEEVVEEETEETTAEVLTGNVVANGSSGSNFVYIAVGIALLITIAGFIIMKNKSSNHPILKTDDKPATVLADQELEDAEKRIKEAEREIRDIRGQNARRVAAQQKFVEAKKALEDAENNFSDIQEKKDKEPEPEDEQPKKEDFE